MSGLLRLRTARPTDHTAWLALWEAYLCFYESRLPPEVSAQTWARLLNPEEPMILTLAEYEGEVVGFVHVIEHRSCWTIANYGYLQDLFVHPDYRGKGIGRALIEHTYTLAGKRGWSRVHWLTQEDNQTARRLYDQMAERSGFIQYRHLLLNL